MGYSQLKAPQDLSKSLNLKFQEIILDFALLIRLISIVFSELIELIYKLLIPFLLVINLLGFKKLKPN
jgi:hypothetical protein|tara:strand:- start:201 stop:404 length:204 start_codon:yes stop_codon:yes gene_type:complete